MKQINQRLRQRRACTLTAPRRRRSRRRCGGGAVGRPGAAAPPAPPISVLKQGMVGRCEVDARSADRPRQRAAWYRAASRAHVRRRCAVRAVAPATFRAQISFEVGGLVLRDGATSQKHPEDYDVPVEFATGNIFSGETDRTARVPEFSVRVSPDIAIVPVASLPSLPTVVVGTVQRPTTASGQSASRRSARFASP